jgi:phosphoribosyl-AMP cyclohydrolase
MAFADRSNVNVESGKELAPKFDASGLLPAVTTDWATGKLLMVAYMTAESLQRTIDTGEAVYWSRSRQELWHKGATSGHVQHVKEIRVDCDQDAVWLRVEQVGPGACHTGHRSCFYRKVSRVTDGSAVLEYVEKDLGFDPEKVYGGNG